MEVCGVGLAGDESEYEKLRHWYDIKPYLTDLEVLREREGEKVCVFADFYYYYCCVLACKE